MRELGGITDSMDMSLANWQIWNLQHTHTHTHKMGDGLYFKNEDGGREQCLETQSGSPMMERQARGSRKQRSNSLFPSYLLLPSVVFKI